MRHGFLGSLLVIACVQPVPDTPTVVAPQPPERLQTPLRPVCEETPPACRGFADTNPHDPALGAEFGASAADALFCAGVVKGHAERCPENRDSRTQEFLCPEYTRGPTFPRQQVMCGACLSSRAELLAFGIKALVRDETLTTLTKCASEGRCAAWQTCEEAGAKGMREIDWTADFFGWALTTDRDLVAVEASSAAHVACRPHDAAAWTDALTFLAELSGMTSVARDAMINVRDDAAAISTQLRRGCRVRGVEHSDSAWISAAIALNNAGISCMLDAGNGLRSANICGTDAIADCFPTRYVLATLVARIRGDVDLAECPWIDVNAVECGP